MPSVSNLIINSFLISVLARMKETSFLSSPLPDMKSLMDCSILFFSVQRLIYILLGFIVSSQALDNKTVGKYSWIFQSSLNTPQYLAHCLGCREREGRRDYRHVTVLWKMFPHWYFHWYFLVCILSCIEMQLCDYVYRRLYLCPK